MPNTRTKDWGYAEAARPQDIYKRFCTGVVLCSGSGGAVDKSVDKVVYVCVHIRFG
jgi:hypothetical protein